MIWNRIIAGVILIVIMLTSVLYMLLKKKHLERGSGYYIAAISILTLIEICVMVGKFINENFQPLLFYIIGVNLIAFLLFFIFFQNILVVERLKKINLIIIVVFIINYLLSALFIKDFFVVFPFISYFVQVVLLTGSIYLVISQTFNSDKILSLSSYFPFWVCLSMLVIFLGVLPLLIVSYTAANYMNLNLFYAILFLVNITGYILLLIGVHKAKIET